MKIKLVIVLIGFLLVAFFLVNKFNLSGNVVEVIPKETSIPPEVYFCPEDGCQERLIDVIKNANTVHCAFYDLDLEELITKLKEKNAEIIIDKDNMEKVNGLNYVDNENARGLMHNKFCIIDNQIIITGSFNPTENDNFKNNNNLIIIHSNYLSKNYEAEFEELWDKEFGSGNKVQYPLIYFNEKKIENYFCPEDSCTENVINALKEAKENVYFMTFTFTSDEIGNALIEKHNDEVDVKGVFEKTSISRWSEYQRLIDNGLNVKKDNNKYVMHHKVFIIDNKTVITGSFNPTKAANEDNDENILIIHDESIAKEYLEEFEKIWNLE